MVVAPVKKKMYLNDIQEVEFRSPTSGRDETWY
jgi:hypothetical protein